MYAVLVGLYQSTAVVAGATGLDLMKRRSRRRQVRIQGNVVRCAMAIHAACTAAVHAMLDVFRYELMTLNADGIAREFGERGFPVAPLVRDVGISSSSLNIAHTFAGAR